LYREPFFMTAFGRFLHYLTQDTTLVAGDAIDGAAHEAKVHTQEGYVSKIHCFSATIGKSSAR